MPSWQMCGWGALARVLGPGLTVAEGAWAAQDEGAAAEGAYETVAGGGTAPVWLFRAGHGRKGLRKETVHKSPCSEARGLRSCRENPSSPPLPRCPLQWTPFPLGAPRGGL